MKKNRKITLCISLFCIFILLVTYSCWFFFYPYRVLGLENDARYYSNHVASNLTGIEEESMSVLDLFVDRQKVGDCRREQLAIAKRVGGIPIYGISRRRHMHS